MADCLDQITPLILTYNEEANISRTLAGLGWAKTIFVIDSGSTDRTIEILKSHHQVEVVTRSFDTFAQQCNFGLSLIKTPWCLSLDADHIVTPLFLEDMASIVASASAELSAVRTPFCYVVHGHPLHSSLLPPRFNLIRPGFGLYVNDGHGHQFIPSGPTTRMHQPLLHDDRKPLQRWLQSQEQYHRQEAWKLYSTSSKELGIADKVRAYTPMAPLLILFLCLIWKRGVLDGRAGIFYAFQRCYAELQIWLILHDLRQTHAITTTARTDNP